MAYRISDLRRPYRLMAAAILAVLTLAAAPTAAGQGAAPGQICEVDSADPSPAAWIRLQRVVARVAERCHAGDVMKLHAFGEGHATEVDRLAPLVCRFDTQILLIDHGGGQRRLVCVYTGQAREAR